MKILIVSSSWIGGWLDHVVRGLNDNNHKIFNLSYKRSRSLLRFFKLNNIVQVRNRLEEKEWQRFNRSVIENFEEVNPDILLTMNQSMLFPETIRHIKNNNCTTVCFIADNPFDSHRYTCLPVSLKYFDKLLVSDKIWIPNIKNVAPDTEIIKIPSGGGYNPELFYPIEENEISDEEIEKLSCDISFTGESYGILAEGGYRSCILEQLGTFNVKIWGDPGWMKRFPHQSNLKRFYQGDRLSYDQLRKMYRLSTINLNMPSPQIFTGFQPRVFEIAACKGFQLVDWREELEKYFNENELVTFRNIPELLEKAEYFIKNPEKRTSYIENMYNKIHDNFTWENQLKAIIPNMLG